MKNETPMLYTAVLYICAFILFLEWLYPVNVVGDVTNLTVFILFTLFCFLISMLEIKWWLSMALKGFGLVFIIHSLFLVYPFLSKPWVTQLFTEIGFNVNVLINQEWYELTPMFRSILFLILIWLMSYLLHYWFIVMKKIFLFVILTFIYLTVLDTFTAYDADTAIVRTFIFSFVALGITNFFKEIDREAIRFSWARNAPIWVIPIISVVLFSTLIGYAAPKFSPQWPDPVPFLRSAADGAGSSGGGAGIQKVGYGTNDSRLGGSFVQSYTPVFQASAKDDHYWRIESKDIYTGKGWERSSDLNFERQPSDEIDLNLARVETQEFQTSIDFQNRGSIDKMVYPYGISGVETDKNVDFMLDRQFGVIQAWQNGGNTDLDRFTITYDRPSYNVGKLRQAGEEDPAAIKERYTQLPESLPERVGELATQVTANTENRYDAAKTIESYFNQNGFVYRINNVPVPKENQDYVDQFLFESRAGYCDNFSTAMVVMLRTLDIPARWVKGFTAGTVVDQGESADAHDIYEVTNANAHSWVEVYFPEVGWVPFEPTQGFSNPAEFQADPASATPETDVEVPQTPEEQQEQVEKPEENAAAAANNDDGNSNFTVNWWYVLTGAAVLLLVAYVLYRTRFRWQSIYLHYKFKRHGDQRTYQEVYHHLLKVLAVKGLAKDEGQTLREYSRRIDSRYNTDEMGQLTAHYERILYRNNLDNNAADNLSQLWKNLIKRIMG
ncbi:transglutaminase domain-containing protein [Virgibacillus kekensis]|uniref:Transglutaminase domain-containing protein n=1 Tax=Virgibacillus kekensis TaxID=202261 RepID=A0ABV9DM42_9BACI